MNPFYYGSGSELNYWYRYGKKLRYGSYGSGSGSGSATLAECSHKNYFSQAEPLQKLFLASGVIAKKTSFYFYFLSFINEAKL